MPENHLTTLIDRLARQPRLWLGPALAVVVLALFFLAAGIDQLDMRPNPIFLPDTRLEEELTPGGSIELIHPEMMERIFLLLLMICTPVVIIAMMIAFVNSKSRKSLIRSTLINVGYAFAIFFVIATFTAILGNELLETGGEAFRGPDVPRWGPAEEMPSWMGFAVALLVLGVGSAFGWYLWLRFRPQPAALQTENTLEQISLEALASLEELRMGGDLRSVIMRCYYDMGRIISEKRGAEREESMTPREFENRLIALGLPRQPVVDLTRLFEEVRYGAAHPSRREEHRAVQSLTAIVSAIGGQA
jgi:hypothetical protein